MEWRCCCALHKLCDGRRDGSGVPLGRSFLDPPHDGGGRKDCATALCKIRLRRPVFAEAQRQRFIMWGFRKSRMMFMSRSFRKSSEVKCAVCGGEQTAV